MQGRGAASTGLPRLLAGACCLLAACSPAVLALLRPAASRSGAHAWLANRAGLRMYRGVGAVGIGMRLLRHEGAIVSGRVSRGTRPQVRARSWIGCPACPPPAAPSKHVFRIRTEGTHEQEGPRRTRITVSSFLRFKTPLIRALSGPNLPSPRRTT